MNAARFIVELGNDNQTMCSARLRDGGAAFVEHSKKSLRHTHTHVGWWHLLFSRDKTVRRAQSDVTVEGFSIMRHILQPTVMVRMYGFWRR